MYLKTCKQSCGLHPSEKLVMFLDGENRECYAFIQNENIWDNFIEVKLMSITPNENNQVLVELPADTTYLNNRVWVRPDQLQVNLCETCQDSGVLLHVWEKPGGGFGNGFAGCTCTKGKRYSAALEQEISKLIAAQTNNVVNIASYF